MEKSTFRMMEHLKRLYAVVTRIENTEGTIPQMEIDLLLEELRGMYSEALLLNAPEHLPWEAEQALSHPTPIQPQHELDTNEVAPQSLNPETAQPLEQDSLEAPVQEPAESESITEEQPIQASEPDAEVPAPQPDAISANPVAPIAAAATALHVAEALADMDSLQFAKEESELPESQVADLPSMEELEGKSNDDLFSDEPAPQPIVEDSPVQEPLPEPIVEDTPEPIVEEIPEPAIEQAPVVEPEPIRDPELFVEPELNEEPEVKTLGEQVVDAPKTLWEQLQSKQSAPTLADMFQTEQPATAEQPSPWSVEPMIAEAQQQAQRAFAQPAPTPQPAPAPQPEPEPVPEPEPEPIPASQPEPTPAPQPEVPQPAPAQQPASSPSLLDLLRQSNSSDPAPHTEHHTLGESFVSGSSTNTDSHISRQKVSDLRTVININDKFSFMSELFHNNMKAYNDFILRLNAINERDEALAYVEDIANQYGWVSDSIAVQNFLSVLDRKF